MNSSAANFRTIDRRCKARRGFTLIEMTLAAAITSLVMAGLFSATLIAARVAESPYKVAALNLHMVLDRMRDDAAVATAVTQLTATSVTLTLPDRNGDSQPESVTYDWSQVNAVTGKITRTYNGTAEAIPLIAPSFAVATDIVSTTNTVSTESAEQLLFTRTPSLPVNYSIKTAQWTGQFVAPSLPSNATSWKVTRVRVAARVKGATAGRTRVQIRSQINGLPKTVIDEALMLESSLTASFVRQEYSFSKATNLSIDGVCLILQWDNDADAAEVQYESLLTALATGNRVTSTDSGLSWTAASLEALSCDVYGTYTIPATGTVTRQLRGLTITAKNDAALAATLSTTIRFINLPVVGS